MEADSTGTITAHNMYGTHLAARTVDGQSCYYLYNAHGDVVMLMDAVTGEVAGTYQYDAFGTLLWSDGYANNSITYAGYQYDKESGLYYVNARYYDSITARFLTEDTYRGRMNDPLSLNRYTYCQNNPVHYTDPSGHGFFAAAALKFVGGAIFNGAVELVSQVFIEKKEKVDWKAVGFEALAGGVEGVFGGTGGKVVKKFVGEVVEESIEYGLKKTAKKAVGAVVHDAVSGFATDVAYQKVVEDKSWDEIDYGSAVKSAAVDGLIGGALEFGSDVAKAAVGSFSTSKRNVDIDVDTDVDVDVDAPKKKTDAPSKKTDTPSTKTDISTKKNVDVPEAEPAPKSTLPDMPEKAKSTGASVSSTPSTSKKTTPELPSVSNKATEVMDELGDSVPTGSSTKVGGQFDAELKGGNSTYNGVKQASEYLKQQGVPRQYRKQTLESFDVRTIKLQTAGDSTYGLRFYGGNANAEGRYLFETFSPLTNRNNLALPYEWNSMTGIQQFKVKSGTTMITGSAAPQTNFGSQYIGGAFQWYINNLEDLIKCH